MSKISVVLAVYNEELNLEACLKSVQDLADEVVIVDGGSTDQTIEIATNFGARIIKTDNPAIFHINKQKALEAAKYEWILQMDADETITPVLSREILSVTKMDQNQIDKYQQSLPSRKLFLRHQRLITTRDGRVGDETGDYNAFFIPRLNYFLGRYLRYGGTYPDPAIRLVRKGDGHFPAKSVHEQMQVQGRVGWLENPMLHRDSPTFSRYLERNNRYINLMTKEFKEKKLPKSFKNSLDYLVIKPIGWFLLTLIRHKGLLDGYQGIIFSFFSALRFPRAYFRYLGGK